MNVNSYISALVQYGLDKELFEPCDKAFIINQLISSLQLSSYEPVEPSKLALEVILQGLLENAVERGIIGEDITSRDLLDTKLMGVLTPPPREVRAKFASLYMQDARKATDWFYQFAQDTDYIRRYRIQKDIRWKTATEYGNLDITINLSKPEKDPKAIAAAKAAPQSGYPKCQLCAENEGYAGRINHPARQNHRIIPITIAGADWYLQYSPYVYYNEHCIVFNAEHTPMKIDKAAFEKLLDFVTIFPHYFVGSNADLPIVGGSILSHEHFQGGHYSFPMIDNRVHYSRKGIPVECPMFLYDESGSASANIDATELSIFGAGLEESFSEYLTEDNGKYDMLDVFDYCYGILSSNTYRLKYAELLSIDFPRIPAPVNTSFFRQVARLGAYLRKLHLLTEPIPNNLNIEFLGTGDRIISGVHFSDNKVYINRTQYFSNVREDLWNSCFAGYHGLQKWFKDRRQSTISDAEIQHVITVFNVFDQSENHMEQLDEVLAEYEII